MSTTISIYIIVIVVFNTLAMWWLIRWAGKPRQGEVAQGEATDHVWDDDLQELNNPMPRWWLWMFYITIIFTALYLLLYPGLGSFKGALGWSQTNQYDQEIAKADDQFRPIFEQYVNQDIAAVAKNPAARKIGQRLFSNYCASCHGSDARGAPGFPNLADNDWLYGGEPDLIKTSILNGRAGVMPPFGPVLGEQGVVEVAQYVLTLSGREADSTKAEAGKAKFETFCAACHLPTGTGNPALGAPNLTDKVWLYGGSPKSIAKTITGGRNGQMPAHKDFLGEDKVHLLAAYVYSLSQQDQ